jgi:predicted nucleic acid-binding protein
MIFVDSSALFALLSVDDVNHHLARICWRSLLEDGRTLLTNNYVIVESMVIIQKWLGIEKVRDFQENIFPFLEIEWVDKEQHKFAIDRVLSANRRKLSLVDCSAFETMHHLGIETVFTFDSHFREEGFKVIP